MRKLHRLLALAALAVATGALAPGLTMEKSKILAVA